MQNKRKEPSSSSDQNAEQHAFEIFKKAADSVPAYADFLKGKTVSVNKIRTFEHLKEIPTTSKENYFRTYPLEDLCWNGSVDRPVSFSSSSGSTGRAYYFARDNKIDQHYASILRIFISNKDNKIPPTLVIIGFGMGAWIGGMITSSAFNIISYKESAPISIITPGINKEEIISILRELAPKFEQVILVGYPPFIKDVIDDAIEKDINFECVNIKLLFAAEAISEEFRDHIASKAKIKNIFRDILNIYGSAEMGAMAVENDLCVLIKRIAMHNNDLFNSLFSTSKKTLTLAQYDPYFIHFESKNDKILFTADNVMPFIKYDIGDQGGIVTFDEIIAKLNQNGIDLDKEIKSIGNIGVCKKPFVYIYERSDFSVKLYGAIIYPEPIKRALEATDLYKYLTGKFTMLTRLDKDKNQYLEINIQLKKKMLESSKLYKLVELRIIDQLLINNAEFKNNYDSMPEKVKPLLFFWPYENQVYFSPTIKQKWIKKIK